MAKQRSRMDIPVGVRFSPSEAVLVQRAATKQALKVATYVRSRAVLAAREELGDVEDELAAAATSPTGAASADGSRAGEHLSRPAPSAAYAPPPRPVADRGKRPREVVSPGGTAKKRTA